MSAFVKILYPDGEYTKGDIEEILRYALESRSRVKEQLKKIGSMEFYDVHFSYIDNDTFEEKFVSVKEVGTSKLIPEGFSKADHIYTVARGESGMFGVFKIETEVVSGNGRFELTGASSDRDTKESIKTAQNYFKANKKNISGTINVEDFNFLVHIADCQGIGITSELALCTFIALCSGYYNSTDRFIC